MQYHVQHYRFITTVNKHKISRPDLILVIYILWHTFPDCGLWAAFPSSAILFLFNHNRHVHSTQYLSLLACIRLLYLSSSQVLKYNHHYIQINRLPNSGLLFARLQLLLIYYATCPKDTKITQFPHFVKHWHPADNPHTLQWETCTI